jgi:hypothetical protein
VAGGRGGSRHHRSTVEKEEEEEVVVAPLRQRLSCHGRQSSTNADCIAAPGGLRSPIVAPGAPPPPHHRSGWRSSSPRPCDLDALGGRGGAATKEVAVAGGGGLKRWPVLVHGDPHGRASGDDITPLLPHHARGGRGGGDGGGVVGQRRCVGRGWRVAAEWEERGVLGFGGRKGAPL